MTDEKLAKDFFKNHQAKFETIHRHDGTVIELLTWAEPGTNNCRIDYIGKGGTLFVQGDLGEAVYRWSDARSGLEFISGCSLGYFAEKCEASEYGRGYESWNFNRAEKGINEIWEEIEATNETIKKFAESYGPGSLSSREEWHEFLRDSGEEFFGEDNWEDYWDIGMDIDLRCQAHLLGIKMACKIRANNGNEVQVPSGAEVLKGVIEGHEGEIPVI